MIKSKKASASRLDRRIGIWQVTETQSESGAVTEAWELVTETWAQVKFPITGQNEIVMADRQTAVTRANFDIRWRSGVEAKMRVRYEGEDYDILSVTEEGRKNFLTLICEKRELEEA